MDILQPKVMLELYKRKRLTNHTLLLVSNIN